MLPVRLVDGASFQTRDAPPAKVHVPSMRVDSIELRKVVASAMVAVDTDLRNCHIGQTGKLVDAQIAEEEHCLDLVAGAGGDEIDVGTYIR